MAAFALGCLLCAPAARAQSSPDPQSKALLFGAAYANSDVSTSRSGGMMFVPGRGLIRWDTRGKSPAEQEEARVEAMGLADARAIQADIDAQQAALDGMRRRSDEAMADREHQGFVSDSRAVQALNLDAVTGTQREAGGVVPLNKAAQAQIAGALGLHEGASFKDRGRLYLFGAVSGRGIGFNLLHDETAGWRNAGLSTDTGGFIGQRQAGIAWRTGITQTAISYEMEKDRVQILGITAIKDHRAMIDFTLTPGRQ